jgi:hypothetical protein
MIYLGPSSRIREAGLDETISQMNTMSNLFLIWSEVSAIKVPFSLVVSLLEN